VIPIFKLKVANLQIPDFKLRPNRLRLATLLQFEIYPSDFYFELTVSNYQFNGFYFSIFFIPYFSPPALSYINPHIEELYW